MELYNKPVVLLNEELSEGVYAASGNPGGGASSGGATVTVTPGNTWGNPGNYTSQFKVTVTNTGTEKIANLEVKLYVTGTIIEFRPYNGSLIASLNGNTITIVSDQWGNGNAAPGGSVSIEFQIDHSSATVSISE